MAIVDPVGTILMSLVARARAGVDIATLLCEEASAALPVSGAGLMLTSPEGSRAMVASSGPLARRLEEIQFVTGEGPSVDASTQGRLVLAHDLATRHGWPAFTEAAGGAGVRAVFAFPVQIGGIRLGVFELHRTEPGSLSDEELTSCLHFLDAATLVLMHGEDLASWVSDGARETAGHGVRAEVHQATGMVSVQAAVALSEALLLLRGRAFADSRSLLAVARDVIGRQIRFLPTASPGPDGATSGGDDDGSRG